MGGLHDDRGDGGLDPIEQARHQRHFAIGNIEPGQQDQDEQGGQYKQHTGDDAAPGAVQQPADIGGQLLRLRPRQQHAVIERMEKASLGNPAAALHQLLVHDGNLAGRAAKADEAQLEPEPEGLQQADIYRSQTIRTVQ